MRKLIINSNQLFAPFELSFDPTEYKDSEALHHALCEIDPGDEYTIQFENVKEKLICLRRQPFI